MKLNTLDFIKCNPKLYSVKAIEIIGGRYVVAYITNFSFEKNLAWDLLVISSNC